MNIHADVEPKWLKNIDKLFEPIFRFSIVSTTIVFLTFVGFVILRDGKVIAEITKMEN